MTRSLVSKPVARLENLAGALGAKQDFRAIVLYEEEQSREWARAACAEAERLAGRPPVHSSWWKLGELRHAGVLAGAVSMAMRADLLVIAVRGTEGMPLPFYWWVNTWLPHRLQRRGALMALLGEPTQDDPNAGRVKRYLRTVARRGRLDLLVEERPLRRDSEELWQRLAREVLRESFRNP